MRNWCIRLWLFSNPRLTWYCTSKQSDNIRWRCVLLQEWLIDTYLWKFVLRETRSNYWYLEIPFPNRKFISNYVKNHGEHYYFSIVLDNEKFYLWLIYLENILQSALNQVSNTRNHVIIKDSDLFLEKGYLFNFLIWKNRYKSNKRKELYSHGNYSMVSWTHV